MKKNASNSSSSNDCDFPVACIGTSAGGLGALKKLFSNLSDDPGMAFVIVQHLDPTNKSILAELVSGFASLPAVEVEDGMRLKKNHIYTIPPGKDLALEGNSLRLLEPVEKRGMRLPVDHFLQSLAEEYREKAVAIILSGTGSDGAKGVQAVKDCGGTVIVQEPETAEYSSMPESAVRSTVADLIVQAEHIPEILGKDIVSKIQKLNRSGSAVKWDRKEIEKVLAVLHAQTGHDFRPYKIATLSRRIERRLALKQIPSLEEYTIYLNKHSSEAQTLLRDLLIGVTGFFREKTILKVLAENVIDPMIQDLGKAHPFRVWVPGCSTGEEAYSMAITIHEALMKHKKMNPVQIFATDIDEESLEIARAGCYAESIAAEVSPERLEMFFSKEKGIFRVKPSLREGIVFSKQNILTDPPFSKVHILSCCNLLIYIEPEVQEKLMRTFHFSLNPGGVLVLGNAETAGQQTNLFDQIPQSRHIFRRTDKRDQGEMILPSKYQSPIRSITMPRGDLLKKNDLGMQVTQSLIADYAPPAVLINESFEILFYSGDTSNFIQQRSGAPSVDLISLAKEGLVTRIRSAVNKASSTGERTVVSVRMRRKTHYRQVDVTVVPFKQPTVLEGLFLVVFEEKDETLKMSPEQLQVEEKDEGLVHQLERELLTAKEDLRTTVEALEASNEELRASNEEVMSMNEELQSSNEELETSKEELQSLNEELTTVNSQLEEKIDKLEAVNADLKNFIEGTEVAILFLDADMRIRRFTPATKAVMNVIPSDVGRPFDDIRLRVEDPALSHDLKDVFQSGLSASSIVSNDEKRCFQRRVIPYRMSDQKISGVTVIFEDITEIRKTHEELKLSKHRLSGALEAADLGTWDWDLEAGIISSGGCYDEIFGYMPGEQGRSYENLRKAVFPDDLEGMEKAVEEAKKHRTTYNHEQRIVRKDGSLRWVVGRGEFLYDGDIPVRMLGVLQDITERKENAQALVRSERRHREILESIHDAFFSLDQEMRVTYFNHAAENMLNRKAKEVTGQKLFDAFPEARGSVFEQKYAEALREEKSLSFEAWFDAPKYRNWYDVRVYAHRRGISVYFHVTTEKKQLELERELQLKLLAKLSQSEKLHEALASVLEILQQWSGCEAIGIRLKQGDVFPYFEMRGFVDGNCCAEYSAKEMTELMEEAKPSQCICEHVINKDHGFCKEYFTEGGSFLSNSLSNFMQKTDAEKANRFIVHCQVEGYESVAIIPMVGPEGCLGLVQMLDHRPGIFKTHTIAMLEQLSNSVALALAHRKTWTDYKISEERFRLAFDNANIGMCIVETNGHLQKVNDAMCDIFGYTRKELESMGVEELAVAEDTCVSSEYIQRALDGEIDEFRFEKQYFHKDGHIIYGVVSSSLVRDSKRNPLYFISHVEDITQERRALEAVKKSEEELRKAQQLAHIGSWTWYIQENRVEWSDEMFHIFAVDKQTFEGDLSTVIAERIHPEDKEAVGESNKRVMNQGKPESLEYRIVLPDQSIRHLWAQGGELIFDPEDKPLILQGFAQDITDRIQMQERIQKMQKMDAIGQLAGGIAHDFNNQLAGIMGFSDLLLRQLDEPKLRKFAASILKSAKRSSDLTKKLLAFARKGKYQRRPVNIHDVISETVAILSHTIDKRIEIEQRLTAKQTIVNGDPSQLQNALLNMGLNARDAMPEGGTLTFETSIRKSKKPFITYSGSLTEGTYLQIAVKDTGTGMSEEVKAHLFEPFYTTKEVGKGTGMGLAAVYGTVHNHGGGIDLTSSPENGTTFSLIFPIVKGDSAEDKDELQQTPSTGPLNIMIVEDEPIIRELLEELLKDEGHHIVSAVNGREAVEMYRKLCKEIDVVILDFIMPEMNGRDCFNELREIRSDVRVLLASGFSIDSETRSMFEEGIFGFIQKPFDKHSLMGALQKIMFE